MSSTLDIMQAVANQGVVPLGASPDGSLVGAPKPAKKKKKSKGKKKARATEEAQPDDDLFRVISNPHKMLETPRQRADGPKKMGKKKKKKRGGSSVHSMSSFSDYSSDDNAPSSLGLGSFGSQASLAEGMEYDGDEMLGSQADANSGDDREHHSRRRRKEDIMQEKIEMLTRISRMSKQGFAATRKWSMRDDIDEIRFECYRMTRENNSKKAVKNMQHGLITVATILEFANNMINPFNLKLQGFSRNMMLTVSDYDDSLEAIHHKWSGRTTIGPELTVLFTFATSAVFHHAGNVSNGASSGAAAPPTSRQQAPRQAPGMGLGDMSSMLGMFSSLMPKSGGATQTPRPPEPAEPAGVTPGVTAGVTPGVTAGVTPGVTQQQPKQRRPMKGPSLPSASMSLP